MTGYLMELLRGKLGDRRRKFGIELPAQTNRFIPAEKLGNFGVGLFAEGVLAE